MKLVCVNEVDIDAKTKKSERQGSLFVSSFANQTKRMRKLEDNPIANCGLTKTLNA